ncbi:hypothetical protein KHP60_06310 [Microvirga sp. 3-52]|jgi:hypothetical protein|uniref:hypothetical protein n=1 Tax=Microvirga sp. 3-52 TaxID=2792425 RepID=UPI001AC6BCE5|nr:hypothetical protein [Microvirga sp. 3-52]MBO1904495.1 hypothetical protein [Microvirga sp. 3-52]MBS7451962.1 hypothetical protein [Microvirga sp. 3-52]
MVGNKAPHGLTPAEQKRRRKRSLALALILGALVLIFYVVTIAKLGPGVMQRPL